jgi:hypothetical protein
MTMTKIGVGIITMIAVVGGAVPLALGGDKESLTSRLAHTNSPQSSPPLLAVATTSQDFHVEGVLEYDHVETGNVLHVLASRAFTVDVAGFRWRIGSSAVGPAVSPDEERLYKELTNSFDGIYSLTVYDGAKLRQANPAASSWDAQNVELVTHTVEVVSGDVPFLDYSFATVPWLAYASSYFFQTNQERRVKNFLSMNRLLFENKDVTVPVEVHYTSTAPRLPDHIKFMNEGFYYVPDQHGSVTTHPLRPPFDRGFEETDYTVEQFTTLLNITVPRVFTIKYYATKPGAVSPDDRRLVSLIRGKINTLTVPSVWPASKSEGLARGATRHDESAGWVFYVTDRRLGSPGHPLTYFTTGPVYQLGDPQLNKEGLKAMFKRNTR